MSEVSPTQLRIYCICGQKMKVTSKMFGKPGKCIACRQKIRIPSDYELPDGTTEIHLKDHPEFLRKPVAKKESIPDPPPDSGADIASEVVLPELELEDEPAEQDTVPFVLFESIARLCNYERQVDEQLEALRDDRKGEYDKATLMGYRGLARKSRQHLEKRIREELVAVASELESLQQALASATLALRTGELAHVGFSKKVLPLRKRREVLVYRQHNLRGWLATGDPHMAGGSTEVSMADVPVESSEAPFPLDMDIDCLPIEYAVLKLEESLRQREKADKRLNELHHMGLQGTIGVDDLKRMRADCEAARERARSGVAFFRARLQQVIQDCEDDSSALNAYQAVKKGALASEAISKKEYEVLEESLFRAQVDIKRARNMATRALNANAVSDVPNPRGTFLERLARPGSFRGLGVDSWLAWVGSALMLAVIFVPITKNIPGGNAAVFPAFTLALFAGASALGLCATIMARLPRAVAVNLLWLALTVAGAAYFQIEQHSSNMAGATLRAGGPWWASLGGLLLLTGWAVAGLASVVAAFPVLPIRWMGPITIALGGALAIIILNDFGGQVRPEPALAAPTSEADIATGAYHVALPLLNGGRRAFWLGGDRGTVPAATSYRLERQLEPETWVDAGLPTEVTVAGVAAPFDIKRGLEVPAGAVAMLHYGLAAGTYRIQLNALWSGGGQLQHTFQLDPFEIDLGAFLYPPANPAAPGGQGAPAERTSTDPVTIELKGVVDGKDSKPLFSIELSLPGGEETRAQYALGDTLHGDWRISEFSPAFNTITVTDGERIIIVERGKPETLP